jgi:hypothetical protein
VRSCATSTWRGWRAAPPASQRSARAAHGPSLGPVPWRAAASRRHPAGDADAIELTPANTDEVLRRPGRFGDAVIRRVESSPTHPRLHASRWKPGRRQHQVGNRGGIRGHHRLARWRQPRRARDHRPTTHRSVPTFRGPHRGRSMSVRRRAAGVANADHCRTAWFGRCRKSGTASARIDGRGGVTAQASRIDTAVSPTWSSVTDVVHVQRGTRSGTRGCPRRSALRARRAGASSRGRARRLVGHPCR